MKPIVCPTPEEIKSVRSRMFLTQESMSELIGVPRVSLARWERGTAEPGASAWVYVLLRDLLNSGKRPEAIAATLLSAKDQVDVYRRLFALET